jgi:hypothetical protein
LGKYSSCPTLWIFVLSNPNSKLWKMYFDILI